MEAPQERRPKNGKAPSLCVLSVLSLGRLLASLLSVGVILPAPSPQAPRWFSSCSCTEDPKWSQSSNLRSQKEYDFTESSNGYLELEIYVASYLI